MQHRLIIYENACELIDHLDAAEILSVGNFQAFISTRRVQKKFILLTGSSDCLVIKESVMLQLVELSNKANPC
ncbi:hypothetical protein [Ectopseudomonas oleovorans]|uniref:hypothetical protein n=1 Tax=Ectopseudomonas oleovorans TaxID=301 RepID=UPI002448A90B|nr:hypothetical protein [Pseudomonas oleovorans]MDH2201294.1 hypothetical protein [Pseudomonas oleovorans]